MKINVACVQLKTKIYANEADFTADIFMLTKQAKELGCALIAFPEGVGAMLAPQFMPKPLVKVLMAAYNENDGASAVKDSGKKMLKKVIDKISAKQDLAATFNEVLSKNGIELRNSYIRTFSNAARQHNMYIVAGSNYGPDEKSGEIVNAAYVFGPDGETLGYQNKIHLYIEDTHICTPGKEIQAFDTDFGKISVPICYEGMFPEISRIMVQKGARALINVSACPGHICFAKIRAGAWSRVQDNLVFGMHSCLVGRNDLSKKFTEPYRGRSTILAPIEYTENLSGVLAEAKSLDNKDFLTAEWDFDKLEEIIGKCDTPINKDIQFSLILQHYNNCKPI